MSLTPENTRQGYQRLWGQMLILPSRRAGIEADAKKIAAGKARYEAVERATGVPWWLIGLLHMRESSCNFSTFLGNGQPLSRVTTLTPKGLGPWTGPDAWERAAAQALAIDGLDKVKVWDIPTALFYCEKFNGEGYFAHAVNSPYVWSGSNLYSSGKFTETPAGSTFVPSLRDPQSGCAPMLQILIATGLIPTLVKEAINVATSTAPSLAPVNTSTGVTVSKAQNVATHALSAIGAGLLAIGATQAHSVYEMIINAPVIGGALVMGLSFLISHVTVGGSNANTLDFLDRLFVAATPQTPQANAPIAQPQAPTAIAAANSALNPPPAA